MKNNDLISRSPMALIPLTAFAVAVSTTSSLSGASLYTQNFNTNDTANWTVNDSGLSDIGVDFFYDYSAIGVPAAPNGSGTRGLKMTANNSGGVFSGFSVSPTGQSFSGNYKLSFDLWQNYVGTLGSGGSGSTQLSVYGVGTAGNTAVWAGAGTKESVFFAHTLDGGSSSDYRAYSSAVTGAYPSGNAVYSAPLGAINDSNTYYSGFVPKSAPAAQLALYSGQTGMTDAGETSFAWRQVDITVLGGIATWEIDGLEIAKVNLSTTTLGGSNILFGHSDINAGSSTDLNDALLNVTLVDNISVVSIIPEPTTALLTALSSICLLRRKRS